MLSLRLRQKHPTGGSESGGLGVYLGVGGAVVVIVAVMVAMTLLIMKQSQQQHDDILVVIPPTTTTVHLIEMESMHTTRSVTVNLHSFASGGSVTDVEASNTAKGRGASCDSDSDILSGQDTNDDEQWEF